MSEQTTLRGLPWQPLPYSDTGWVALLEYPADDEDLCVRFFLEEVPCDKYQGYFHAWSDGGADGVTSRWFDGDDREEVERQLLLHVGQFLGGLGYPSESKTADASDPDDSPYSDAGATIQEGGSVDWTAVHARAAERAVLG